MSRYEQARAEIVAEVLTWERTPWRHASAVKGAGVDCARLLIEVYAKLGLIEHFIPEMYPQDFALHSNTERFLQTLERYAIQIEKPKKGDVAVWKYGKCFSHGAIIINYPQIIHAKMEEGVIRDRADAGYLSKRDVRFYSVFSQ